MGVVRFEYFDPKYPGVVLVEEGGDREGRYWEPRENGMRLRVQAIGALGMYSLGMGEIAEARLRKETGFGKAQVQALAEGRLPWPDEVIENGSWEGKLRQLARALGAGDEGLIRMVECLTAWQ